MMSNPVIATIIACEPCAQYQGTVYDQSVRVSLQGDPLPSKHELTLFDDALYVTEDMIGDEVRLTLSVLPSRTVETLDDSEPDILEVDSPISEWSYDFIGDLVSVGTHYEDSTDSDDQALVLNIGIGEILVQPNDGINEALEAGTLRVGDALRVIAARTDIADLVGDISDDTTPSS